jgi:MoaA/NifB/PqqE/SkfB family radical SAM enzyme
VGNAQGGICKRVEAQELIGRVSRIDSPMFLNKKRTFEIIASRLEGRQAHFKCRSPYNYIFIFATCDVYPCSVIDEKMGNLRENKIKDIFFSRQFVRMRRSIKNGKNEVCKTCTHGCEIDASIRR